MKKLLELYRIILRPWVCVLMYLWLLELQAVLGTGSEPLLDSLADSIAILWTLIIWSAILSVVVMFARLVASPTVITRANQQACRVACVIISGLFLTRWLNASALLPDGNPLPYGIAIVVIATAYFYVRRQRKSESKSSSVDLPSWDDCFHIGVVPLLLASVIVVAAKVLLNDDANKMALAQSATQVAKDTETRASLPNIIVFVSDSLRAESMSVYGNPTVPTPVLAKFASESSVYLDMHANSTTTGPSMAALLTGQHPLAHGRLSREPPFRFSHDNLLRVLREHGYQTAAVTSNLEPALSSLGFTAELTQPERFEFMPLTLNGLRDRGVYPTLLGSRMYQDLSMLFPFLGYPRKTSSYGEIQGTLNRAMQIITRLKKPYFLLIHIHEPHESDILPTLSRLMTKVGKQLWSDRSSEVKLYAHYDHALQSVVDNYRAEYEVLVRKLDAEIGKFFKLLEQRTEMNNTLIVFTADHGESFERGYLNHGEELYENSTHIPLLIRFPGQKTGERVVGLTQTIDVAPTVLRAVNIPVPDWMVGQPLEQQSRLGQRAVVAINFKHPDEKGFYPLPTKLSIWWNRYKLIVMCALGGDELYDLKSDPEEQINLVNRQPDLVRALRDKLAIELAKQTHEPKLSCPNM